MIKFVRANCLVPWICKNFKFKRKPIYFLRHPVPTALSQVKAFDKYKNKNHSLVDHIPNQLLPKYKDVFQELDSFFEKRLALWCIHNKYTLEQKKNGKSWTILFYEHMLLDPEGELKQIEDNLGIKIPSQALNKIYKPSKTDYNRNFLKDPERQINKWTHELSNKDLERAQMILDYFNIKIYSAYNTMPLDY